MEKDKPSEQRRSWIMRWFQRWLSGGRSHTVTQEDGTGHHSDDQKRCDLVVIPEERTLSLQAESNVYDVFRNAIARYRASSGWPKHDEEVASPSTIHNIGVLLRSCGDEIPSPTIPIISKLEETWDWLKGSISSEEKPLVSSLATNLGSGIKTDCKYNQFLGPGGNVDVELTDESGNRYSVRLPAAGSYLWRAAGLGFVVRAAVTLQVAFASWDPHLAPVLQDPERWMVAGPLFDVAAEPGEAVAEIHLPHFVSLQGAVDVAWFQVAHFKEEGMILEQPARVEPFHAALENPSFSLMGVLLRIASGTRLSVPITSSTLVYHHAHPEDSKFHLYLIPSDSLLRKAIDEEEAKFQGMRLQTSPPLEPLNFASRYIVSCSAQLEIIPEEMKLSSRGPREIHHFTKIYAGQMKEQIQLEITDKRHGTLVWKTLVKPVDLQFGAASAPPTFSGAAFVKENLRHLQARLGDLSGVLDDLQDSEVLTENEKELVEQAQTQQRRNETLLRFMRNKGDQALEKLYRSLNERDPYLVSYLRQPSLSH
ncbi:caspase recruitment domain-containing protein 8-like isoform X2 [Choloepus didactylus]|uniref:caspase recruitment domain-containing protein 8-like isoform X2 n=1 Tax=Choloepus didactylus TaxID=27675 RepID=UPI00189FB5EA|nr:caspase recruitment domain-containing protein 8-like isoform X2 [Choloepus didactylus]